MRGTGWALVFVGVVMYLTPCGWGEPFNGRLSTLAPKVPIKKNHSLKETSQLFRNKEASADSAAGKSGNGTSSSVNLKSAPGMTVWVDVNPPKVQLDLVEGDEEKDNQRYRSGPVEVTVDANYVSWVMFLEASDANGPGGSKILARDLFVSLEGGNAPGNARHLKNPLEILAGGIGLPKPYVQDVLLRMVFTTEVSSDLPAGIYTGQLTFFTRGNLGPNKPVVVAVVDYCIIIQSYCQITVNPGAMNFGTVQQGDNDALNGIEVKVRSNQSGGTVVIDLGGLSGNDHGDTIPPTALILGHGSTPAAAVTDAHSRAYGDTHFVWTPPGGTSRLYLFGRAQIDLTMQPDQYAGLITVTK